jgi:hypothetical protein
MAVPRLSTLLRSPRGRTALGVSLAVLFIPVVLGIMACFGLQTPIGDPEKGWADPRVSGAWLWGDPVPAEHEAGIWVFEPWDGRTWLVAMVMFSATGVEDEDEEADPAEGGSADGEAGTEADAEPEAETEVVPQFTADDLLRVLDSLSDPQVESDYVVLFKGWLTSIGGRRFLVLEPRMVHNEEQVFGPPEWWVFRLVLEDKRMLFYPLDRDVEDLGELTARGPAEQVILRHADDPEFYDDPLVLYPVPREAFEHLSDALTRAGIADW